MPDDHQPLYKFLAPRHWPLWISLGLLRLSCLLPLAAQLAVGRALGRLFHRFVTKRRRIARRNIELCFPELSEAQHDDLTRRHFESLGMSLMEISLGWWASDRKLASITHLTGIEHIEKAQAEKRAIVLLTGHFTTLEISGRKLRKICTFDAVYRKNRDPFITEILRRAREQSARHTIEKNNIKQMVRSLREGVAVWYAPDQSYRRKQSALLPFFDIPAMTNTATTTLARLGKAVVLPYFPRRLPDNSGYEFTILPALENFPSDDPIADTEKYVSLLEERIRLCPEQYYWVHRKFKGLPDCYPDYYADLAAVE